MQILDLVDDEELGLADWPTIKIYITCLHDPREHIHTNNAIGNDNDVERMHLYIL